MTSRTRSQKASAADGPRVTAVDGTGLDTRRHRVTISTGLGIPLALVAGEAYQQRHVACFQRMVGELDLGALDPLEDPLGYMAIAGLHLACGVEVAEEWAASERKGCPLHSGWQPSRGSELMG
jgi:hypothetical protein